MRTSASFSKPGAKRAIITAGLIAGSLDIISACVQFYLKTGKNPVRVLKFVASGVFGKDALAEGTMYAAWGLLFHYLIAFSFTLFFFWIYPRWKVLSFNKYLTAVGYGLFVWLIMNRVVVPLSQTPKTPFQLTQAMIAATILICMIGLPLSLIIGKYYSEKQNN